MSEMSLVEQVARTICIAQGNSPDRRYYDGRQAWRNYEHAAEAVIELLGNHIKGQVDAALKEPEDAR